ncbi:hypothetical protein Q3G72_024421 [Acer saccharum]|nr:hypothetical protein Q3G72_024421 [Acer saccharum]
MAAGCVVAHIRAGQNVGQPEKRLVIQSSSVFARQKSPGFLGPGDVKTHAFEAAYLPTAWLVCHQASMASTSSVLNAEPVGVEIADSTQSVIIHWSDDHTSRYPYWYLRGYCPCATNIAPASTPSTCCASCALVRCAERRKGRSTPTTGCH